MEVKRKAVDDNKNSDEGNKLSTVELQWLEHLWDHENLFGTGVVRANEG